MAATSVADSGAFWEYLHAALGLQHDALALAEQGEAEAAARYERQAIALLLEATCLLDPDEPALNTVRSLATSGMARLRELRPRLRPTPRRRDRVASGSRRAVGSNRGSPSPSQ